MSNNFYYMGFLFIGVNLYEIIRLLYTKESSFSVLNKEMKAATTVMDFAKIIFINRLPQFLVYVAYMVWWFMGCIYSDQKILFSITLISSTLDGYLIMKIKHEKSIFWKELTSDLISTILFAIILYNHFSLSE